MDKQRYRYLFTRLLILKKISNLFIIRHKFRNYFGIVQNIFIFFNNVSEFFGKLRGVFRSSNHFISQQIFPFQNSFNIKIGSRLAE